MTRKELINRIAEKLEVSKKSTGEFVTAYEETIKESMVIGEEVNLMGFMKTYVVDVPTRMARNPKSGESVEVKAHKTVKVKVLKELKDAVK